MTRGIQHMNIINIHEDHHSQMLLHLFLPLGPVFPHALLKSIEYVLANTHQVVQPLAEWLNSRKGPSGLNAEVDLAFRWVCDAVATKLHVRAVVGRERKTAVEAQTAHNTSQECQNFRPPQTCWGSGFFCND